jgi:hypothetical protein
MVPILSLWLPILLSAVIVFVASSIIHMLLPVHAGDYKKLPSEDSVMEALRKFQIPAGDYLMPRAGSMKDMGSPAFIDKLTKGPVAMMTIMPSGKPSMLPQFVGWFAYCTVVGIFAAYIAGRALGPGAHYRAVFRFAGATAFIGYSLALWQQTIWYHKSVSTTLKQTFDGLVYALVTAGMFGWLWPR